jgi:hypothetical protein
MSPRADPENRLMSFVDIMLFSTHLSRFCALCFALVFAGACSVIRAELDKAACTPDFPLKDGWLGGDSVSSILLSDGRTLWLFGDTFIAAPTDKDRTHAKMIANSVAVSACTGDGWSIAYAWRQTPEAPHAIFESSRPKEKYWPLSGILLEGGEALIFLVRVRTVKPDDPFGFQIVGADLAYLKSNDTPPQDWRLRIEPLYEGTEWIIGAAAARDDSAILVLAARQVPGKSGNVMTLLRLSGKPGAFRLEAHNDKGVWQDFSQTARSVFPDGSSEASMFRDARHNWLLIHTQGGFAAPQIMLRRAPNPDGPWSPAIPIARYAEMTVGDPRYRSGVFCYAAKAHDQFSNPDKLFITYACNSADTHNLLQDMTIYRPRIIWAEMNKSSVPAH